MRPKFRYLLFIILAFFLVESSHAQENAEGNPGKQVFQQPDGGKRGSDDLRVMFYNTENLFDPIDDSLTADEEYTPGGMRGWSFNRMKRKIINLSKVILSVGGWNPPEIIGFCEVENRFVLYLLTNESPLKNFGYKIVHHDSPDPRGIDVALIYRPEKFRMISYTPIPIRFPFDTASRTRDILFVQGIACKRDTLNIFVNHWPSKYGGSEATIPKRNYVASVLRAITDSMLLANPTANILIMGDLNDSPREESISKILKARMDSVNLAPDDLYDLLAGAGTSWNKGTIKFQEEWEAIDHMIVSRHLLTNVYGLHTSPHGLKIFDAPFLLQDDEAWFGKKPFRTYYGSQYIGGFSDHLPVYMDLSY